MNRRGFIGRIAAATAAVPVLTALGEATASAPPAIVTPGASALAGATSKAVETVASTSPDPKLSIRSLLTLRHERGLMVPCPNCRTADWHPARVPGHITCSICGWEDTESLFVLACRCADCSKSDLQTDTPVDAPLRDIEFDAPVGLYRVVEGGSLSIRGREVTRRSQNVYAVYEDRLLHNVIERRIARVSCAIKVGVHDARGGYAVGLDRTYQPNGNVVLHYWEILDCYEWQQARGEQPPLVQETDAQGWTWRRYDVPGSNREAVILCGCADYLNCEHAYPAILRWRA